MFGTCVNGEGSFLPRFLKSLDPPPDVNTIREAIHFVSKIPFIGWENVSILIVCILVRGLASVSRRCGCLVYLSRVS